MSEMVKIPEWGEKITQSVPNFPIIPFIEGDGIGADITPVMQKVVDAAVFKAFGDSRKIAWMEVFAGEKAQKLYGEWFPAETLEMLKAYRFSIKGPMTTPVGGGIRSLNVMLRQSLDLYQCVRPVRYFAGVPSPLKHPEDVDMVIFRENTEDIYAGIEWQAESPEAQKVIAFLQNEMKVAKSVSPTRAASASSPFPSKARHAWCAQQFATPLPTNANR